MPNLSAHPFQASYDEVSHFLAGLRQMKQRRLSLSVLWSLFDDVFLHQPSGPERRLWLLALLHGALNLGIIRFPALKGPGWERSLTPALPYWVHHRLPIELQRHDGWRHIPWHPSLAWVPDLGMLTAQQEVFLLRVQQELVKGTFQHPAPVPYRSLQLMGDEKYLKRVARTALFQPGRLSFDLLGCTPDIPPFHIEELSEQPRALIFENASSFRTAASVLKRLPHHPYGLVGFGGGTAFEQAVRHLTLIARPLEAIEYVGDLDRPGLRTAHAASERAQGAGLPLVIPATGIHQAMLASIAAFNRPEGIEYQASEKKSLTTDPHLVCWLPEAIRNQVLAIIRNGYRVPEEVLSQDEFSALWKTTLEK